MTPQEKKSKREVNYGLIFAILTALNLVAGFSYGMLFYIIDAKGENAAALLTSLESETKKIAEIKSLTNVIETTKEERKELDSHFLRSEDIVTFIEKIESLGKDLGVVVNFESVNILERDGSSYLAIDLKTEGSLPDTVHFLSLLELLPQSVSFERVFIEQRGESEKVVSWTGSFLINLLSFTKEK